MQLSFKNLKSENLVISLLIGIVIVVFTFPENDWVYSPGIDSSLKWLYNWMFDNDPGIGKSIIFPHGPLSFLMYPLQENIISATLFLSFLKVLLVFNVSQLIDAKKWSKWFFVLLFAYIISVLGGVIQIILANILLLFCNYFKHEKIAYKLLAFAIAAVAFYMRSYVAIISLILCTSFLAYYFFIKRNYKKSILDGLTTLAFIIALWILMYGTISGLPGYFEGIFHLAQDNSSAAAYYPQNNWIVLTLFLAITFSLPFLTRTKSSMFFGILVILSLFAAWKHGMAREDIVHVKWLLTYAVIVFFVYLIFEKKNRFRNSVLAVIAVSMFSLNIKNAVNAYQLRFQFLGIGNFIEFVSNYSEIKEQATEKIEQNISVNKFPEEIRDQIGNKTVDIYPWDYSIVSANDFNWQPRRVIQSYASYTHWLDKQNADHFGSEKAPGFLIWEVDKVSSDINSSNFGSIDNRYLLNDEPQTILQILRNYERFYTDLRFLVLKRRDSSRQIAKKIIKEETVSWGEWLQSPDAESSLLRAKLLFDKSLVQRIKSFLYKDEQFWIYFKLKNNQVHKYRIVPKNAEDGLWINPYFFDLNESYEVEQIMFKCSNQKIIENELILSWEKIEFKDQLNWVNGFFKDGELKNDSIVFSSSNDFETDRVAYWSRVEPDQFSEESFSGTKSYLSKANSFSATFTLPLDSLPYGNYHFVLDGWIKSTSYKYSKDASFVIVVDDENGKVVWKGQQIDEQLLDKNYWNHISNKIGYNHQKEGCTLKAYFWNKSDADILVDDMKLLILEDN